MTRAYDEALRPVGLRITQFSVLARLDGEGEARVRDLGAALEIEETTLTRSLATMEKQGWVSSRPGDDRRERYVFITPAGRKLFIKAVPSWKSAQQRVRGQLSGSTWDALFSALPEVVEAASASHD